MGSIVELSGSLVWLTGGHLLVALGLVMIAMEPSVDTAEQVGAGAVVHGG